MGESRIYTVVAIDDHPLFRKGVSDLIGMEPSLRLVAEAANGSEGLQLVCEHRPDLVLLDINMKGCDGLETLKAIKAEGLGTRVLMFTVSDHEEDVISALRLGADGYLLKDMEPEDTLDSLRDAVRGRLVVSERLTQLLAHALRAEHLGHSGEVPLRDLTERERQTLKRIARGLSNKQIARELVISEGTVKVHVKNLLRKLQLHSRVEAAVWALKQGL